MAEPKQFAFTFKELAEILVKQQKISEGYWGIFVKFGIQGTNLNVSQNELLPTAVVPILEIGIQKFDESNALTIDASTIGKATPVKKEPTKNTKSRK